MIGSIVGFVLAAATSASMVPLARRFAFRMGAVDEPGGRRVHRTPIARLGGLAIFVAFFLTVLALAALESGLAGRFIREPKLSIGLFAGGALMVALGAIDDIRGVRAIQKLAVQIVAACIAYWMGFRIPGLHLPLVGDVDLGSFALPLTVIWIVGVVNALNLIDGLDGLAAGIAFFACVTNYMVASLSDSTGVMLVSAVLGGALMGFLVFNFNPATIFLGDSGSLFLGYILATTSLLTSTGKSTTAVAILVPVLALGVPIVDTLFAMVRRLLERRPIFSPDRGHIHHRLLDLGVTHRRAVLILYGISGIGALCAIALAAGKSTEVGFVLAGLAVGVTGVVRFIASFQTRLARERERLSIRPLGTERLRRSIPALFASLDRRLSPSELRRVLTDFASSSGVLDVELWTGQEPSAFRFSWRAECVSSADKALDAVYSLDRVDPTARVRFAIPGTGEIMSPQDHILLQLAADAVEQHLASALPARVSVSTATLAPDLSAELVAGEL